MLGSAVLLANPRVVWHTAHRLAMGPVRPGAPSDLYTLDQLLGLSEWLWDKGDSVHNTPFWVPGTEQPSLCSPLALPQALPQAVIGA